MAERPYSSAAEAEPSQSSSSNGPASGGVTVDDPPIPWDALRPSAQDAMRAAAGLADATSSDSLHMEHLLGGLYREVPGPARFAIEDARVSEREFVSILAKASNPDGSWPREYRPRPLDSMPLLSRHVAVALRLAMDAANREGSRSVDSRHLFFGAMSVEDCEPVTRLARRDVDKDLALRWAYDASDSSSASINNGSESVVTPPPPDQGAQLKTAPSTPEPSPQPAAPPRLTLTASAQTDQPTSIDRLGHDRLVDALVALLNGDRTTFPLTIAISAPWGGGKSSVMRLLRDRLIAEDERRVQRAKRKRILDGIAAARAQSWVIVEFPAWRYETGEQLWAAMAKATYDAALKTRRGWRGRAAFRMRLESRRGATGRLVLRGSAVGLAAVIGAIVGGGIGAATGTGAEGTAIAGGAGGIFAVLQALGASLADPFKQSLEAFAKRSETGDGFTLAAARQVDSLMDLLLENEGRVLIMIDDVDRCTPHNLVRVIEAVNQIFVAGSDVASKRSFAPRKDGHAEEKPRKLVFLMGMDRDFVARGIEVEYKDLKDALGASAATSYGFSFLDKIIQLWVTLPEPKLERLRGLLRSVSGNEGQNGRQPQGQAIAVGAGSNGSTPDAVGTGVGVSTGGEASLVGSIDDEPPPQPDDSEEVTKAIEVGAEYLERNPRKVKRYNNAFRLQFHLASRSNDLTKEQLNALARWVAIRLRWDELAKVMDDEPDLLRALEVAANDKRAQSTKDREMLDAQMLAHPKWFDGKAFADCDELMKALASPSKKTDISRLPFEDFLQVS